MAPSAKLTVKDAGLKVTTPEPAQTSTNAALPDVKAQDSANPLNLSPTGSDEIKKLEPDTLAQPAQGVVTGTDPSTSTPSPTSSAKTTRKRTPTPKAAASPNAQKKSRGIKAPAAKVVKKNSRSPKRKADDLEDDDDAASDENSAATTSLTKTKKIKLSPSKKPARGKSAAGTTSTDCNHSNHTLAVAVQTKLKAVEQYIRDNGANSFLTFEPKTQITTVFRHDVFTALTLLNLHFELPGADESLITDLGDLIIETVEGGVHEDWNRVRMDLAVDANTGAAMREKLAGRKERNWPFLRWELEKIAKERDAGTLLGAVDPRWRDQSGLREPGIVMSTAESAPLGEVVGFRG
ncbi:hypothetical protein LTR95_004917 [Oleoguttula sp. CCFEE 5521]